MKLLHSNGGITTITGDTRFMDTGVQVLTELLSGEIMYSAYEGPLNEFASKLANKPIYGSALLCDAEEEVLCRS